MGRCIVCHRCKSISLGIERSDMRMIRFFGISILVLFGVLTAVFSLFPSHIRVSRLISIRAGGTRIDSLVCGLGSWEQWNQFTSGMNAAGKPIFIAVPGNNPLLQSDRASVTILNCSADSVTTVWKQKECRSFTGTFQFTKMNDELVMEWDFDFYLKWYPWEKMSALFFDKQMGPNHGIFPAQLKQLAEKNN